MIKEIASTQFTPKTPSATRGPGKATLARILQAAGEVLQESGYEGLNTTAVAQRAGVSTATMYRHFPDKHAVLHAGSSNTTANILMIGGGGGEGVEMAVEPEQVP